MKYYNPNIHHRRSIRLKDYDYSQEGLYFITICCQDRANLFGSVENGEMILNTYGAIALEQWRASEFIRDNCKIHETIVMPNHIHGIIEIVFKKEENNKEMGSKIQTTSTEIGKFKSPSQTIGAIIRGFKIATIKRIKDSILEEETKNFENLNIEDTLQMEELNNRDSHGPIELKEQDLQERIDLKERDSYGRIAIRPDTKKIKELNFKIWQRNYYEHIIRDEKAYQNISNYIINNPKKWDKKNS
ncbi:MAG: hypothetical protein M9916_07580 [Crocinitomicaceae bacterium]|nr:hypothetical protein [Crocinitomicaceae bacterium]